MLVDYNDVIAISHNPSLRHVREILIECYYVYRLKRISVNDACQKYRNGIAEIDLPAIDFIEGKRDITRAYRKPVGSNVKQDNVRWISLEPAVGVESYLGCGKAAVAFMVGICEER